MNSEFFSSLLARAEGGDIEAMDQVALMYAKGENLNQNDDDAKRWFWEAINRGSIDSMYKLGIRLAEGSIGERDPATAFILFQRVANADLEQVCRLYGSKFVGLHPVYEDFVSSKMPYLMLTQSMAMHALAVMLSSGNGVPADPLMAVRWLLKSFEKGLPDAAYALGVIYWHGKGVQQDKALAIDWFKKAARMGHADSQNFIERFQ
jgi:TPR repeat protein